MGTLCGWMAWLSKLISIDRSTLWTESTTDWLSRLAIPHNAEGLILQTFKMKEKLILYLIKNKVSNQNNTRKVVAFCIPFS